MLGKLLYTLANSSLGAIITHAVVTEDGTHLASAESGDLIYWSLQSRLVIFSEKLPGINQLELNKPNDKCLVGGLTPEEADLSQSDCDIWQDPPAEPLETRLDTSS